MYSGCTFERKVIHSVEALYGVARAKKGFGVRRTAYRKLLFRVTRCGAVMKSLQRCEKISRSDSPKRWILGQLQSKQRARILWFKFLLSNSSVVMAIFLE